MPPSKFLKLSHLTTRFDRMFKISWRDRWCTNRLLQRIYTILDYVSTNLAVKARLHHQYSWSCSLVDRRQSRWFHTACTSTSKSLSEHPDSLHVAWKCLRRRSSEVLAFSHSPVGQTFLVSSFDSWFNNVKYADVSSLYKFEIFRILIPSDPSYAGSNFWELWFYVIFVAHIHVAP